MLIPWYHTLHLLVSMVVRALQPFPYISHKDVLLKDALIMSKFYHRPFIFFFCTLKLPPSGYFSLISLHAIHSSGISSTWNSTIGVPSSLPYQYPPSDTSNPLSSHFLTCDNGTWYNLCIKHSHLRCLTFCSLQYLWFGNDSWLTAKMCSLCGSDENPLCPSHS